MKMSKMNDISPENKDKHIEIGLNIAFYRKRMGMNQLQLAEAAKVSRSYISVIEAPNMVTNITIETLLNIASALQIPPSRLLEFRD